MATSLTCPDPRDLKRLALGQLPEPEAEQLGQHVLACSPCAVLLDNLLAKDSLTGALRGAHGGQPADNPFVDALVERLIRAAPGSADDAAPSAAATETPGTTGDGEPLPERVGRYQIVGRLGAGGMGVVCRAHDPKLGRDVAIKMPSFRGSEESRAAARQRFLREARAAAAVRHANVCPIYDVGEEQNRPYVVMALVEGESLGDRLRRQGRFEDSGKAVALVIQVADALAAVHAAHIIHRDLKPGNILLDRAGQPFLADFGLARADDSEHLTSVGQVVGTPAYMAPEQAAPDLGLVGPWSDQYSLGVMLYQMLTGRLPFEGSVPALIYQIATKTVPPPSQHRADLDADLEHRLLKALARQPRDRYPSVLDFAGVLRAWPERATVAPANSARTAEHRRLTLLSCGCDLFDSQAILDTLDPEEQHDLLLDFQQLCRDLAAQWGGTVVKATDHGLLICFGIPVAQECAARRAVRTGLDLLDRMASLNERLGQRHKGLHLSARMAVHSGRAVVTENGGRGEALAIVGQVLPVVDQLEHLAAPDTLVISDDTHRLVRRSVECTSLGTHQLKGTAGAKPVYRVHRELVAHCNRVDGAGPLGPIPLIGRDREVALLQERWEQAREGTGQVVLLVGEAGIGKSSQVRVLKEHVASGRAAMIIEWPCGNLTQNSSLFPAIEFFDGLLDLSSHEDSSHKLDKLATHLEQLHLASAEAVALLASLLSIALDGRYPPLGMSPQRQKEKTFDLLLDWLREQAQRQPVLFVVEDLHWIDPATLEFVDLLVGQVQGDRVLAVLTFRPEFTPPWKSRGHHTQVPLNRLSRRQTGELMLLKSGLPTIPPSVLDQVADRTDGVPLFVEEFTAMVLEAGSLYAVGGPPQLSDAFEDHAIPATLQDLLLARLERAAGNFEVVQLAATIGREFSYELLQAVAPCDEEVLHKELARLVEAELLFARGRLPRTSYQFKHVLIQEAAYQSLLKKKRQQFHVRIAEALEHRFPETCVTQPEILAHHFTEGNAVSKAVTYWERAGERAQQRGSPIEAIGHFTRGLELISTLPETRARHAQEIQIHISLGVALAAAKGYGVAELEVTYARAHALCLQTGLTAQVFPALFGRLRYCINRARYADAQELAEEMLRLAEREANAGFLVCAHCALGWALLFQGQLTEALLHLERVVAVEATAELRLAVHRYVMVDPWVSSHLYLSLALWLLGFPERAAEHSRRALSIAEGLGHPFSLGFTLSYVSWLYQFGQDREKARTTAARALAVGRENGFAGVIAWGRILCGWAVAELGQSEPALAEIRQGLEDLRVQAALRIRHEMLPLLADACARAGRPGEGLKALAESLEFAEATGETFFQAEIYRLKSELLLRHHPTAAAEAEVCLHQALKVSRGQQARSLELRAAMSLGQLWHKQGKTPAARALLAPIFDAFTEGFQTHDLQTARALLEQWQ